MIIPRHWAEFRLEQTRGGRHAVFRRWGWSDDSEAAALRHAQRRAHEAWDRWFRGDDVPRRERRRAYNGAEGSPIREEIVDRSGETVVTRNAYGALCLNTPDVLFADIDHDHHPPGCLSCLLMLVFVVAALWVARSWQGLQLLTALAMIFGMLRGVAFSRDLYRSYHALRGGFERVALSRVERFVRRHPDWSVRAYRTPAGLRLLAMHRTFDPCGEEAARFFREVGADPLYVRMCRNQHCFRARLTPKPWRIGVAVPGSTTLRTVWPVPPARLAERAAWVAGYDEAREGYAACAYLRTVGSAEACAAARAVARYHDEASGAERELPLA